MSKKRPWKKHAQIERIELNSGDVKFVTYTVEVGLGANSTAYLRKAKKYGDEHARFEDLTSAEQDLDAWWADWWPKQTKSSRPA
jgi:hypothetical protein